MQRHRGPGARSVTAEQLFGRVLRDVRKRRGLTQEALAFESGYHPTYIGHLERGQKSPSLRTILSLARALRVAGWDMVRRVERQL